MAESFPADATPGTGYSSGRVKGPDDPERESSRHPVRWSRCGYCPGVAAQAPQEGVMAARTMSVTREIEGRDSVGLYLDEIARTPLLDAAAEVELSKAIEAGLLAQHLLDTGRIARAKGGAPKRATREELEWLVAEGERATQHFIQANL